MTEIEALKIESTRTIEIETFVPQAEVDQIYLDSPYYLAPDDKVAEEAFAVIREAMTKKKMVGIGRIVLARRERMLMLQPRDKGMLATTLRYPYEVRAGRRDLRRDRRHRSCRPRCSTSPRRSSTACRATSSPTPSPTATRRPSSACCAPSRPGQTFTVPEPPAPANVVNIMDALKKSLEAAGGEGAVRRPRAPSKKPAEAPAAKEAAAQAEGAQETRGAQSGARVAGNRAPRR